VAFQLGIKKWLVFGNPTDAKFNRFLHFYKKLSPKLFVVIGLVVILNYLVCYHLFLVIHCTFVRCSFILKEMTNLLLFFHLCYWKHNINSFTPCTEINPHSSFWMPKIWQNCENLDFQLSFDDTVLGSCSDQLQRQCCLCMCLEDKYEINSKLMLCWTIFQ